MAAAVVVVGVATGVVAATAAVVVAAEAGAAAAAIAEAIAGKPSFAPRDLRSRRLSAHIPRPSAMAR
jgi:hypothetical protein